MLKKSGLIFISPMATASVAHAQSHYGWPAACSRYRATLCSAIFYPC